MHERKLQSPRALNTVPKNIDPEAELLETSSLGMLIIISLKRLSVSNHQTPPLRIKMESKKLSLVPAQGLLQRLQGPPIRVLVPALGSF